MTPVLILADVTGFEWIAPILQFGVGGGVLVWFMFKAEPRMRDIEAAIDRLARAILLLIVTNPQVSDTAKSQAQVIQNEADNAERKRTGK